MPADTLAIYSIGEQSRLDGQGLQELCPTMLQQLDAGTCKAQNKEEQSGDPSLRPTDAEGEHWLVMDHLYNLLATSPFVLTLNILQSPL